jgi:YggT family protein
MNPIFWLLHTLIEIYSFMLLAFVVLSMLTSFGIVNARQPLVSTIGDFLYRITEPVLAPIRRRMPDLGAIDISPLVLLLALQFVQQTLTYVNYKLL